MINNQQDNFVELTLNRVIYLGLSFNELTGEIPAEIGNLTELISLNLCGNQLTGSIPAEIGWLTNLGKLDLRGNYLNLDNLPPEITSHPNYGSWYWQLTPQN